MRAREQRRRHRPPRRARRRAGRGDRRGHGRDRAGGRRTTAAGRARTAGDAARRRRRRLLDRPPAARCAARALRRVATAGRAARPRRRGARAAGGAAARARDVAAGCGAPGARREPLGPLAQIARAVYDAPDPVAMVAAFTRDVADAARGGDEAAAAICAAAGRELGSHGAAAVARACRASTVRAPTSGGAVRCRRAPPRAAPGASCPRASSSGRRSGDALDGAARLLERPTAVP